MLKLMFKLGLVIPVVLAVAATGVQINTSDIDNDTLHAVAKGWNVLSDSLHEFVVEHDDEVIDMSKNMAGKASESAVDAVAKVGEYVSDNKDDIKDLAAQAGERLGQAISSDD